MAAPKTLTSRIHELINTITELDRPAIKAKLVRFARLAEALENGTAARKVKSKITLLQTALETSEAAREESDATLEQLNAEIGDLKSELQTMQAEIAKYQEERTKQAEREREMPPIQFQILSLLPNEHGGSWLRIDEIARALKIKSDEAEVHANKLKKAGLVISRYGEHDALVWHRSDEGNELVIARRLAGEEEAPKPHKYADLPKIQHDALLLTAGRDEGMDENEITVMIGGSLALVRHNLRLLEEAGMATDGDEPDYGTPRIWVILRKGTEYLAERDLL